MHVLILGPQAHAAALAAAVRTRWEQAEVQTPEDATTGLAVIEQHQPEIVLLDTSAPFESGLELLRRIRQVSEVPVILLDGRFNEDHLVRGLDRGADEYIARPFSSPGLVARMAALIRRAELFPASASPELRVGELVIQFEEGVVTVNGQDVGLTAMEYRLVARLARYPGHVVTHQALLESLWGREYGATTRQLKVFVNRVRTKLARVAGGPSIQTVRGVGYRFVLPVPSGHACETLMSPDLRWARGFPITRGASV
jgi:DNA-binding response OmpR family regulator